MIDNERIKPDAILMLKGQNQNSLSHNNLFFFVCYYVFYGNYV